MKITITIPPELYEKYKGIDLEQAIIAHLEKSIIHKKTWKVKDENQ